MKAIFTLIACVVFGFVDAQNLLINGNAESGDLMGWSIFSDVIAVTSEVTQTNGAVLPLEGDFFFTFSNQPGESSLLSQNGIVDIAQDSLRLTGYFHGEFISDFGENDFGEAILYVYDSDSLLLNSTTTGDIQPNSDESWVEFMLELPLLANSYSWRIELHGSKLIGDYINVFYDDLELTGNVNLSDNHTGFLEDKVFLYPNPTSGNVFIANDQLEEISWLEVYSNIGTKIGSVLFKGREALNLTHLPNGHYIVVGFNTKNEVIIHQMIQKF